MEKPVLMILAGGMGSRYGGIKQMDPVDESGHWIIDYSIYDAKRAGFEKVVCIVSPDTEETFKGIMDTRAGKHMDIKYVCQRLTNLPEGFSLPKDRVKPWGTAHAVLSAKKLINGPFAAINADDFYGADAYQKIYEFLMGYKPGHYALLGYNLMNTLTEHGHVSRGECIIDGEMLVSITERVKVLKQNGGAAYTEDGENYTPLSDKTIVSMNFWGLGPDFFGHAQEELNMFLSENVPTNPLGCEFFLPTAANSLLQKSLSDIKVIKTDGKWLGVTYKDDMPHVRGEIAKMLDSGQYPKDLWK